MKDSSVQRMTAGLIPCRNTFIHGQKLLCYSNSPVISLSTSLSALSTRVRSTAGSKKADPNAQNTRFQCILKSEQARAPKPSSSYTESHFKQLPFRSKAVCVNRGRRLGEAIAQDAALFTPKLSSSHQREPSRGTRARASSGSPDSRAGAEVARLNLQNFQPSSDFKPAQIRYEPSLSATLPNFSSNPKALLSQPCQGCQIGTI